MASQHFRAGVVVIVRHPDLRRVMAFERVDSPGSWQLPQGGLKVGEQPIEGAWRELTEETGLGPDDVIARSEFPEWLVYEWPAELKPVKAGSSNRIGQVQRWFLFDARTAEVEPSPDGSEFAAWQWAEPQWLIDHVPEWRRAPYAKVLGTL
ncbi:MAG: NUDIX domain-containing protein [Actinomycetota bacterium]|nr:NUDIX domain-containing protein [Actinomycetota bacterium]